MEEPTSVAEAREIMGSDADKFSDTKIEKMIKDADLLSEIIINEFKKKLLTDKKEPGKDL